MTKAEFWEKVIDVCCEFGGSVTSGIRSSARNAQVGGVPNSWHLTGYAADVVLDDWGKLDAFGKRATKMGLRVIDEVSAKDHVHLQAF